MHLTPLYDKIVVKLKNNQSFKTQSGIEFTKNYSTNGETIIFAEVVAVGEGRLLADGKIVPMKVKVGDTVIYSKMSGESFNDGEADYTILSEANILAIKDK